MVQLNKDPILWQTYELIGAIEKCGASTLLTEAVVKAGDLMIALEKLVDEKKALESTMPPMVYRPVTGRTIPDLTKREHICEWQREVRAV
jgi:hypothetical protein